MVTKNSNSLIFIINCPHATSPIDIKNFTEYEVCSNCNAKGPNLWICMKKNCLLVGCSEQAKDHSSEHFKFNLDHCLQMNISTKRIWCYMCDREVSFDTNISTSSTLNNNNNSIETKPLLPDHSVNFVGLVGLKNLANTCYMNSALQALSNIQPMTQYFLNCGDLVQNITDKLPNRSKTGLAKNYQKLIQDIWSNENKTKDCIAPRSILNSIRAVHPMFHGVQQHDSQEFLRCFMDLIHEELKEQCLTSTSVSDFQFLNKEEDGIQEPFSTCNSSRSNSISETDYESCDSNISEEESPFLNQVNFVDKSNSSNGNFHNNTSTTHHQTKTRSIITDIFDGKLLSSVQCLSCNRISTREETFQDLSLPIPSRDYLNVLHQSQYLSSQCTNSNEITLWKNNESWFSWVWSYIRSWLWGPSVTIYDCLASFFSADELKGDNMYSCEKCEKLRNGIKYSKILELPEVICIHLKRFRNDLSYSSKISSHVHFPLDGFDLRPYIHKKCKSNIWTYYLVSVICHHGTVGGGHYTCLARNELSDRWYEYDDHNVTEVTAEAVQNCQAYVLFYRKYNHNMNSMRSEAKELSLTYPADATEICFYILREWLIRFETFAEPGPINNYSILCSHGGILQSKTDAVETIVTPISQSLWDFFYRQFGGGPAINLLFLCEYCKFSADVVARRQQYELSVFTKYNKIGQDVNIGSIYAISMQWLRKWLLFAQGRTSKEPGPITNTEIARDFTINRNICPCSDFAQIKEPIWRFLHGIYGGGPEIILKESTPDEASSAEQPFENDSKCNKIDNSDTESNLDMTTLHNLKRNSICVSTNSCCSEFSNPRTIEYYLSSCNRTLISQKHKIAKKQKLCNFRTIFKKKSKKRRNNTKHLGFFSSRRKSNLKQLSNRNQSANSKVRTQNASFYS